jgi:hypothetical protein
MMITLACVSEDVCQNSTKDEQDENAKRIPMKVVLSEPSLIDYYGTA